MPGMWEGWLGVEGFAVHGVLLWPVLQGCLGVWGAAWGSAEFVGSSLVPAMPEHREPLWGLSASHWSLLVLASLLIILPVPCSKWLTRQCWGFFKLMPSFNGDLKWHTAPCSATYSYILSIKKMHGNYNSKLLAIGKFKIGCAGFKSEDVICLLERSNEGCLLSRSTFHCLNWHYST